MKLIPAQPLFGLFPIHESVASYIHSRYGQYFTVHTDFDTGVFIHRETKTIPFDLRTHLQLDIINLIYNATNI